MKVKVDTIWNLKLLNFEFFRCRWNRRRRRRWRRRWWSGIKKASLKSQNTHFWFWISSSIFKIAKHSTFILNFKHLVAKWYWFHLSIFEKHKFLSSTWFKYSVVCFAAKRHTKYSISIWVHYCLVGHFTVEQHTKYSVSNRFKLIEHSVDFRTIPNFNPQFH